MPAKEAHTPTPTELSFALSIRLETAAEPWCATLSTFDGLQVRFDSPLALVRHLGQLAPGQPPTGGLR
jgi:hypothetical protein